MPSKQGTINVVDNSAFVVASVPVSALHDFDDDGDGLLSSRELTVHQASLRQEMDRRLVVADGEDVATTVLVNLVSSPADVGDPSRADHLVALKHARFAAPVRDLRVTLDLFGTQDSEQQMSITATRAHGATKDTEVAIFTPRSREHRFFRPPLAALGSYVHAGVEHILFGADHLVFLLTILVAGWEKSNWRNWLKVVSAFTVGHSLTLGLAALGYIRAPSHLVEPLIALSIVLMAADNLIRNEARVRERAAIVGACGLLHGLGFASSMDTMGLDGTHRLLSIVGFNAGVELGQGAFLSVTLALLLAVRRIAPRTAPSLVRAVSLAALLLGLVWMVERATA